MRWLLVSLIRVYQVVISPLLGPTCRYYPSCSRYAVQALDGHGAIRGSWLAARRLGRCHPWAPGGVDLVPQPADYRWWGRCPGSDPDEHIPDHSGQHNRPSASANDHEVRVKESERP